MTFPARHISIAINRSADDVYAFASDPRNLPQWASGLSNGSLEEAGGKWVTQSPMGKMTIEFAKENSFGVLDHDVTLPTGEVFFNPMRVIANDDGCEVMFTLYRRPEMTDEAFAQDGATIEKDLQ